MKNLIRFNKTILPATLLLLGFIATTPAKALNQDQIQKALPAKINDLPQAIKRVLDTPELFNAETCSEIVSAFNAVMYTRHPGDWDTNSFYSGDYLNPEVVPPVDLDLQKIEQGNEAARILTADFYQVRLDLQQKWRKMVHSRQFTSQSQLADCGVAIMKAIRTLRGWEDYWGLWYLWKKTGQTTQPSSLPFQAGLPYTFVSKPFRGDGVTDKQQLTHKIQDGDVILARGHTFVSSFISRIAEVDNQFSHLAIVHADHEGMMKDKDPGWFKGKLYVSESLTENGLVWSTLDDFLTHSSYRLAIFRLTPAMGRIEQEESADNAAQREAWKTQKKKYEAVSSLAGKLLLQRAVEGKTKYNFRMNIEPERDNKDSLFCSQAVTWSLEQACTRLEAQTGEVYCEKMRELLENPNEPIFPLIKSRLPGNNDLLRNWIKNTAMRTISPADVEIDPRLELVMEWRDYSKVNEMRMMDMTLTKIFQWTELGKYHFNMQSLPGIDFSVFSELALQIVAETKMLPRYAGKEFIEGVILTAYLVHSGYAEVQLLLDAFGPYAERFPILAHLSKHAGLYDTLRAHQQDILDGKFANKDVDERVRMQPDYMSDYQMDRWLETLRRQDCRYYLDRENWNGRPPHFHFIFRESFEAGKPNQCNPEPFGSYGLDAYWGVF